MSGEDKTYVGIAPCGCIRTVCVDNLDHKKDTAATIARCVKLGLAVERWETAAVRSAKWDCGKPECPFIVRQASLL